MLNDAKSGTAEELISPKAGMDSDTALQAVLDNVVLVNFVHDVNQFQIQARNTAKI